MDVASPSTKVMPRPAAGWWGGPQAMGFGDVRLAGWCGGALGWLGFAPFYLGFVSAFVTGALMGVAVLVAVGRRRFPFAPALAFGTMFGVSTIGTCSIEELGALNDASNQAWVAGENRGVTGSSSPTPPTPAGVTTPSTGAK